MHARDCARNIPGGQVEVLLSLRPGQVLDVVRIVDAIWHESHKAHSPRGIDLSVYRGLGPDPHEFFAVAGLGLDACRLCGPLGGLAWLLNVGVARALGVSARAGFQHLYN